MNEENLASAINSALPGRQWILIYEGTEEGRRTILKMPHKFSHAEIISVLQKVIEELRFDFGPNG